MGSHDYWFEANQLTHHLNLYSQKNIAIHQTRGSFANDKEANVHQSKWWNPYFVDLESRFNIFYRPQTKLRKGNVFTAHVLPPVQCMLGYTPPWADTPSPRRPLQRMVRILLECILVESWCYSSPKTSIHSSKMCTAGLLTISCSIPDAEPPPPMQTPLDADPPLVHVTSDACWEATTPSVDRKNDTRLWKHYLPANTVAGGKNIGMAPVLVDSTPEWRPS